MRGGGTPPFASTMIRDSSTSYARATVLDYPVPQLADELVVLRRWEVHDLALVEEAAADPDLVSGTTLPDPYSPEEGLAFVERQWRRHARGEGLSLAIEEQQSGLAVGCTTLMLRLPGMADLGYWLIHAARGRGLGPSAVGLLVPWALGQNGIEAVDAFVHPDNTTSRRLLERAGFTNVGSERHAVGRMDENMLVYRRTR